MSFCVQDASGQHWLTAFDEEGVKIMGITANDLEEMAQRENGEEEKTATVGSKVFHDYVFKVRAKMEDDRDGGKRLRATCAAVQPVNYVKEAGLLADAIREFGV